MKLFKDSFKIKSSTEYAKPISFNERSIVNTFMSDEIREKTLDLWNEIFIPNLINLKTEQYNHQKQIELKYAGGLSLFLMIVAASFIELFPNYKFVITIIIIILLFSGIYALFLSTKHNNIYVQEFTKLRNTFIERSTAYGWKHVFSKYKAESIEYNNKVVHVRNNVIKVFKDSDLYPQHKTINIDDIYASQNKEATVLAETYAYHTKRGHKRTIYINDFIGHFIIHKLSKKIGGTILLRTHDTKEDQGESNLEEVDLEWNDFEKIFDLLTDNQLLVREIFRPNVMEYVYELYKIYPSSFQILIKGNNLIIAIPTTETFEPAFAVNPKDMLITLQSMVVSFDRVEKIIDTIEYHIRNYKPN